jgi:hypothetical protein
MEYLLGGSQSVSPKGRHVDWANGTTEAAQEALSDAQPERAGRMPQIPAATPSTGTFTARHIFCESI